MRRAAWIAVLLFAAGCQDEGGGHVYRIPSSAMEPTLHCAEPGVGCLGKEEDRIYTKPYGDSEPQRGDIVVFQTPPAALEKCGPGFVVRRGLYVKRIVGLPLETWYQRDGFIYIDGERLREPYIRDNRRDSASYTGGPIPGGRYLLLGDNRASTCDSRIWGLVPRANIRGKVVEIKRGSKRIRFR